MSAWIVSKGHIDYIVGAMEFYQYGQFTVYHDGKRHDLSRDEWGKSLWAENMRSVAYRYPNDAPDELPGPISFEGEPTVEAYRFTRRRDITRIGACKAIDSYSYQSCEHPEWETSLAKACVDQLFRMVVASMPEYDAADTWSVE
jgi:hypothetical protein